MKITEYQSSAFLNAWRAFFFSVFILIALPVSASASFTVSPLIIDYTTEARDIINRDILLTNNTDRPIRAYASVHEITVEGESEIKEFVTPAMTDRTTTITSWLEISRARLEIPAKGTLTVPLTVRIHPNAPAGEYHALIGFATGSNRDDIEAKVRSGDAASVILKITIEENVREQLQVVSFVTDRFTFKDPGGSLSILLENTGDVPLTPAGEVIIYDTSGKELASLAVNERDVTVLPGERVRLEEPLPFLGEFGRHKAYLSLSYGQQQANVFDTAFYFSLPWYYLLAVFLILLTIFSVMVWLFRRAITPSVLVEDIYELPLYVSNAKDHEPHDHDLDLTHDKPRI